MPTCEQCPIAAQYNGSFLVRVGPAPTPGSPIAYIVGESPGASEVLQGEPFVGASGTMLDIWCHHAKVDRRRLYITNAVQCRPALPLKPAEWKLAIDCCRDQLLETIKQYPTAPIIALGGRAFQSLLPDYKGNITSWAGEILQYEQHKLIPNFHPAFCLRKTGMIPVAEHVFKRGISVALGVYKPTSFVGLTAYAKAEEYATTLQDILRDGLPITIDVENNKETSELICVGLGNVKRAVSIPFPIASTPVHRLFQECLVSLPNRYHNGQHDRILLEDNGFRVGEYEWDTMLAAAVYAGQQPKDLGMVATCCTRLPRWKSVFRKEHGWGSTIGHYCLYNAQDCQGTAVAAEAQGPILDKTHRGRERFAEIMELGKVAIRIRRLGILVDQAAKEAHGEALRKIMAETRAEFEAAAPGTKLGKVGIHDSLKELFFDELGLKPLSYTASGERSLNAFSLQQYCSCGIPRAEKLATMILKFRKAAKVLTTYIDGLPVGPDGRVHCTIRVDGTLTGRFSSAAPNMQNQPKSLRNIYVPRPGYVFLSGDLSQAEVYAMAALSGATKFLRWFKEGVDIHKANAATLFAVALEAVTKAMRTMAKIFIYCLVYGGTAETCWSQMKAKGFDVRLNTVRLMFRRFFKEHPEIQRFQTELLRKANETHYVEEVLSGRREHFPDGRIEPTKILNYPEQAGVATIVNRALLKLDASIDRSRWGIFIQVHDELDMEVPREDTLTAAQLLKDCLEQEVDFGTGPLTIPAEVSVGNNWRDLEKLTCLK